MSCFFAEISSDRDGWTKLNLAQTFDVSGRTVKDSVERISTTEFTAEEFIQKFESQYKPVVLTHTQDDWMAKKKWTLEVSVHNDPDVKCNQIVARNSEVLGWNPSWVVYFSSRLCIYGAQKSSKACGVQCSVWYCALIKTF